MLQNKKKKKKKDTHTKIELSSLPQVKSGIFNGDDKVALCLSACPQLPTDVQMVSLGGQRHAS
jgi:hypothetical protein